MQQGKTLNTDILHGRQYKQHQNLESQYSLSTERSTRKRPRVSTWEFLYNSAPPAKGLDLKVVGLGQAKALIKAFLRVDASTRACASEKSSVCTSYSAYHLTMELQVHSWPALRARGATSLNGLPSNIRTS
ncbi:hypothetical protein M378DRAFT_634638 [Amanita muscaria Koide BX008]|uniref:Uncharacterized protein n=1 Tax=Amanita muscaria (strain Koide BX008) TaxID=946122 RepID=A0A0C2SN08_AMAMK|nr:hypothetical protein M378DRAFT_634638 [Amanita muscaria Koide BX008]